MKRWGAVGPRLEYASGRLQLSCGRLPHPLRAILTYTRLARLVPRWLDGQRYAGWDHSSARAVGWVSGAALLTSRSLFRRLGGFDESIFLYSEDADLCWRVRAAGYEIHYFPGATVVHLEGQSSRQHRLGRGAEGPAADGGRLGIGEKVCFSGYQPDVRPYLAAGDIFVLPGRSEGQGLALLEAMATGLPAVTAEVGGVPELGAWGQVGLLFLPQSVGGLAQVLRRLLASGSLRRQMGRRARQLAAGRGDPSDYMERLEELYLSLAGRGT